MITLVLVLLHTIENGCNKMNATHLSILSRFIREQFDHVAAFTPDGVTGDMMNGPPEAHPLTSCPRPKL